MGPQLCPQTCLQMYLQSYLSLLFIHRFITRNAQFIHRLIHMSVDNFTRVRNRTIAPAKMQAQ